MVFIVKILINLFRQYIIIINVNKLQHTLYSRERAQTKFNSSLHKSFNSLLALNPIIKINIKNALIKMQNNIKH